MLQKSVCSSQLLTTVLLKLISQWSSFVNINSRPMSLSPLTKWVHPCKFIAYTTYDAGQHPHKSTACSNSYQKIELNMSSFHFGSKLMPSSVLLKRTNHYTVIKQHQITSYVSISLIQTNASAKNKCIHHFISGEATGLGHTPERLPVMCL